MDTRHRLPLVGLWVAVAVAWTSPPARGAPARADARIDVADLGAVGDLRYLVQRASIASGGTALAVASGGFAPSMAGETVIVPGAGAGGTALMTTIRAVVDARNVELATAAATAIGGATVSNAPVVTLTIGTDDTAAFNRAFALARSRVLNSGSILDYNAAVFCPQGEYLTTGPIDVTGITADSIVVSGPGCRIHGAGAGNVVVDALGSRFLRWSDVAIFGDRSLPPRIGLQIGRTASTDRNSSDDHVFARTLITGDYTLAAMLNEQAETSHFDTVRFSNDQPGGYGVILDGYDHFAAHSTFIADTEPVDRPESFNENLFTGCVFAGVVPLWIGGTSRLTVVAGYGITLGSHGVELFNEFGGDTVQADLSLHMENSARLGGAFTDVFLVTGTHPYPQFEGFRYRENGTPATRSVFRIDPAATAIGTVSMPNADLDVREFTRGSARMFDQPSRWAVSGRVFTPTRAEMNLSDFRGLQFWSGGALDLAPPPPPPRSAVAPGGAGEAIPAPLRVDGLVDSGALRQAGPASFAGPVARSAGAGVSAAAIPLPATGAAPEGATVLTRHVEVVVGCSSAAAGAEARPLQLPAGAPAGAGYDVAVLNRSGHDCLVYPPAGGTIENGGTDVPARIERGSDTVFRSTGPGAWWR